MVQAMWRVFALALLRQAIACQQHKDCGACVRAAVLSVHGCSWCEIDQGCHSAASLVSPCTPEGTAKDCISLAPGSHCSRKSSQSCASATADALRPQQIHLALAGPRGMRVAWKTDAKPTNASVLFALEASGFSVAPAVVHAERSTQYLASQGGHGFHHVATLRNLTAGARYWYQVNSDGITSEPRAFTVQAEGLTDARFLVVADMGYGDVGAATASRKRMEALHGSVDLTIHAGDIGYADDSFTHANKCAFEFCYESVYDNYMSWIENLTDSKPYMVAVGNHESECHSTACLAGTDIKRSLSNFTAYNTRWAMPSPESGGVLNMWYSFDYASVHFVVINTETDFHGAPEADYGDSGRLGGLKAGHFAPDGAYLKWLEADLAAAARSRSAARPWIVAVGHRPWVIENGTHTDKVVEEAHAKLFERYGVDLYLSGHIHAYHRLVPSSTHKATPVVVTGGAGCDEFPSDQRHFGLLDYHGKNHLWDYRIYTKTTQVGVLTATSTHLTWEAFASDSGESIDSFTLNKTVVSILI
eukprot:TRINITY_DN27420_c0_g1_i1.p1 TRINITY_DN27420_c0_g1~~TRINITY_DN27420_c0_g1_i1.p1  ORF type:complete len:543 (-),score=65.11 TRINITY_DN27420_c0_g1_i1:128-1720(-)